MTQKIWPKSFAPLTTITFAAILTISLALASTVIALSGPWLGIVFDRDYSGEGVMVERVMDNSPATGKLQAGDVIKAFVTAEQGRVDVFSSDTMDDPDHLSSYATFNAFFEHQQILWQSIKSTSLTAILSNDTQIDLASEDYPGPQALPASFWWLLIIGGLSFLVGVSAWCLRSNEPVTRVLAISGFGFMVGAYSCAIYLAREIAISSKLFFALVYINHFGIIIFAYAAILFFWYYPRKLGDAPVASLIIFFGAGIWFNELMQWFSWPLHTYYAHFIVAYCLLLVFSLLQWKNSKNVPQERAMLRWLLATMLFSLGFTIVLFYLPIIVTGKSIASTVLTFAAVFAFYVGLVIGIIRYQQFDMQHWWIRAWQWLLIILIVLCADSLFVYVLKLTQTASISLTMGAASIYLIARQWLWGKYSGNNRRAMDYALPHLVDALVLHKDPDQQWQQLISRVFNPLTLKIKGEKLDAVNIEQDGMTLHVPSLDNLSTIEVLCCEQGKRMFEAGDVKLANLLLELMRHSKDIFAAHEHGVQEERQRIQKDLHDDVAARLLSLLHQTREPMISKVASNALRGLRDVIHLLGAEEALLEDVMSDIEAGAREQLAGLGINFTWKGADNWPAIMLSSQQHINLRRIARETIANSLKHAVPRQIIMEACLELKEFFLRISNDDTTTNPLTWIPGRGLNNIKSRVMEMGGSHEWGIEHGVDYKQYCYLSVKIPLSQSEKLEKNTPDRRL